MHNRLPILGLILVLTVITGYLAAADPQGTQIVSNVTEYAPVGTIGSQNTTGGSFTTLVFNTTSQTPRWKAYVGNVTGSFTLDDADGNTLYDWTATTFTGEVYSSRSNSVDWDAIRCAQDALITTEHTALNMTAAQVDNVNRTFNDTIHTDFFIGSTYFTNSTCRAIATYVNDTAQAPDEDADFQVVLLDDTNNLVFAALLEQNLPGFDNLPYDFQMIVPESDQAVTPHVYYFYTELG